MSEWKELNGIVEVAEAVTAGMEIERKLLGKDIWEEWLPASWFFDRKYRARKPAMKKVKSLCWRSRDGVITWAGEDYNLSSDEWKRFPAGDIEGEVDK